MYPQANQLGYQPGAPQPLPQQQQQLQLQQLQQLQQQPLQQQPQLQPQLQQQPEARASVFDDSKILSKIELLSDKLEHLKSLAQVSRQSMQSMPSMDTAMLVANIERMAKENEQFRQEIYEKSGKIAEQNGKITELLLKAQAHVEQKHLLIEQSSSSLQSSSERSVLRVLELEQDKMKLTGLLGFVFFFMFL
jgi:FK506-binding protein 15